MKHDLGKIVPNFQLEGSFIDAQPYGNGHINDTYLSLFEIDGRVINYIHQHINHNIFKEPEKLMENITRVTEYTRKQVVKSGGNPDRESLTLIPTIDGKSFYHSPEGEYWRSYIFIAHATSYDLVEDTRHIYNASKAFAAFQQVLSTLPGKRLHETIPDFHNTRKRFDKFLHALEADKVNRATSAKPEIEFVLAREAETAIVVDLITSGKIPERVTHNDTKLNNVMIDDETGEGVCVIDLDTVMPGSVLYDFGDSVRIGASTALEDEQDLSKVDISLDMFDCLASGYLEVARNFLNPVEIEYLAFSAKLMTFECGMRFLTDYLDGDNYFKVHREGHNLDRCRTQFKMVGEMEQKSEQMNNILARYL